MPITSWNYPIVTDPYSNVLADLRFRDTAAASWLDTSISDFTSLTDIPTKAKRWNDSNKYWEIYNGSSWVEMLSGAATYNINVAKLDGKVLSDFVLTATRAAANGVATLNADVVIPAAQIGDIDYGTNTTNSKTLRHRRMTTVQLSTYAGTDGELVKNTTTNRMTMMDGTTLGGTPIVSGTGDGSFTTITVSGLTQLGTIQSGVSGVNLLVNSSGLSIGNGTPDNTEGWNRNLWVQGSVDARIALATTTGGISAGYWVTNTVGYLGAAAGAILGTSSANPLTFVTNGERRLQINAAGDINIYDGSSGGSLSFNSDTGKALVYLDSDTTKLSVEGGVRLYDASHSSYYAITDELYDYPASFPEFCRFSAYASLSYDTSGNIFVSPAQPVFVQGDNSYSETAGGASIFERMADFSSTGYMEWIAHSVSDFTTLSQVLRLLSVDVTLAIGVGLPTRVALLGIEIDYSRSYLVEDNDTVAVNGTYPKRFRLVFRMFREVGEGDFTSGVQNTVTRLYVTDLEDPLVTVPISTSDYSYLVYTFFCQICPTTAVLKKV